MTHSDSLSALAPALVAAQAEMEHAHKNAANPFFRSKYADLAEVIDTVRPVLHKHGLSVVQVPGFFEGIVTLDIMLLHKSGEWIRGQAGAPIAIQQAKDGKELPPSPQGVGSAITYLRRYSLAALCGITQDDDDGNEASRPARTQAPAEDVKSATEEQRTKIKALLEFRQVPQKEKDALDRGLTNGLTAEKAASAITWLQGLPEKAAR